MAITLSDITTFVDETLNDPYLTSARMQRQVGVVLREIHQRSNSILLKKEATFNSVASQSDYDLSSGGGLITDLDGQKVIRLRPPSTTYREVEYVPYDLFYQSWPNWLTAVGDPIRWTWEDWQIMRLNPTPNGVSTYTLYYYRTMTEIDESSDDNTTIDIPDKYRNVITDGALYKCAVMIEDDRAEIFKRDYEESKSRMCLDLFPRKSGIKVDVRLITNR